jgi:CheY-like chemotaxis protein
MPGESARFMKVLVVDDEKNYLTLMGDLLRTRGYSVFLAADGKEAREIIDADGVDLVVSDLFMPTMDGFRFHSYVRDFAECRDVPFIFVSGIEDERTAEAVVDPDIDYFFTKTTPVETILALIERLKAGRQKSKTVA